MQWRRFVCPGCSLVLDEIYKSETLFDIILYTENVLKLGSAIHKLVRIVNYQTHAEHYTSFVQSTEDNTQWFYVNDTSVSPFLFCMTQ